MDYLLVIWECYTETVSFITINDYISNLLQGKWLGKHETGKKTGIVNLSERPYFTVLLTESMKMSMSMS